jgi:hypothetical protein
MSLHSGKSLLSLVQSTELISISGRQSQHQIGYINHTRHKSSPGGKTYIKNSTYMRPSTYGHASFDGQSPQKHNIIKIEVNTKSTFFEVKLLWARFRLKALRNCVTAMRVTEVT